MANAINAWLKKIKTPTPIWKENQSRICLFHPSLSGISQRNYPRKSLAVFLELPDGIESTTKQGWVMEFSFEGIEIPSSPPIPGSCGTTV